MTFLDEMTPDEAFQNGIRLGLYFRVRKQRKREKIAGYFYKTDRLLRHITTTSDEPLGDTSYGDRHYQDATIQITATLYAELKGRWKFGGKDNGYHLEWLDSVFTRRKPLKMHTINHVRRYID